MMGVKKKIKDLFEDTKEEEINDELICDNKFNNKLVSILITIIIFLVIFFLIYRNESRKIMYRYLSKESYIKMDLVEADKYLDKLNINGSSIDIYNDNTFKTEDIKIQDKLALALKELNISNLISNNMMIIISKNSIDNKLKELFGSKRKFSYTLDDLKVASNKFCANVELDNNDTYRFTSYSCDVDISDQIGKLNFKNTAIDAYRYKDRIEIITNSFLYILGEDKEVYNIYKASISEETLEDNLVKTIGINELDDFNLNSDEDYKIIFKYDNGNYVYDRTEVLKHVQ